jgi:phosphate/sulfate permease
MIAAASNLGMPMWNWIAIGVGGFLVLSAAVGLAIARILGTIAEKISELQETDDWAMLPPARAAHDQPAAETESKQMRAASAPRRRASR